MKDRKKRCGAEREEEEKIDDLRRNLQGSSSGDDLNQLLGDDGLSGTVEGEGKLVDHLG